MRVNLMILLIFFITLFSCQKENEEPVDYREAVTGDYQGVSVVTRWVDDHMAVDSSDVLMTLTKSDQDSLVDLSFSPPYSDFTFRYENGKFFPTASYHPPGLILIGDDSLIFHHQPGLGPYRVDCYAKKVKNGR